MTPLWIALIVAVINLGLAITLSNLYNVPGLALANSIAAGCELLLLVVILRRRWQGIDGVALLQTTVKALAAAAIMGVGILAAGAVLRLLPFGTRRIALIGVAVLQLGVGAVGYLGAALLLQIDEVRQLPALLFRPRGAAPPAVAPRRL